MTGPYWTKEEEDLLYELFLDGCTPKEMAGEIGRSEYSVKCKLWNSGHKRPVGRAPNEKLRALVLAYLHDGLSISQIGKLLGRKDPAPIWKIVKKLEQQGLVKRTVESNLRKVRYKPTKQWTNGDKLSFRIM